MTISTGRVNMGGVIALTAERREEIFQELWSQLDHEKIGEAIAAGNAYKFDSEEAGEALIAACRRWLPEDVTTYTVQAVEREQTIDGFKFVTDVECTYTGEGTKIVQDDKSFSTVTLKPWAGKKCIIDWKTGKRSLDARWQDSYTNSHQWRDYLAETGAEIFVYRGIKRKAKAGDEIELREFAIHRSVQPDLEELHRLNIAGITAQRDALIDANIRPWPQNRNSCGEYGGCFAVPECNAGLQFIPVGNLEKGRPFSYSRMEEFRSCAEKHRRSVLARMKNDEESSGPDAEFGSSFHRGIAEVYRQVFLVGA